MRGPPLHSIPSLSDKVCCRSLFRKQGRIFTFCSFRDLDIWVIYKKYFSLWIFIVRIIAVLATWVFQKIPFLGRIANTKRRERRVIDQIIDWGGNPYIFVHCLSHIALESSHLSRSNAMSPFSKMLLSKADNLSKHVNRIPQSSSIAQLNLAYYPWFGVTKLNSVIGTSLIPYNVNIITQPEL